jgi:hypothetical protein
MISLTKWFCKYSTLNMTSSLKSGVWTFSQKRRRVLESHPKGVQFNWWVHEFWVGIWEFSESIRCSNYHQSTVYLSLCYDDDKAYTGHWLVSSRAGSNNVDVTFCADVQLQALLHCTMYLTYDRLFIDMSWKQKAGHCLGSFWG